MFSVDLLRATIVEPIPGARLAIVDCGHEIPLDRPRELAAIIEAYLAAPCGLKRLDELAPSGATKDERVVLARVTPA
jgi:hypothetical protein